MSASLCPLTLLVFFPYQKEILSWNPLFPFITFYAVPFCQAPLWIFFSLIVSTIAPFWGHFPKIT